MKKYAVALGIGVLVMSSASAQNWTLRQRGTILEIFYGVGTSPPQYAALHTDSAYFRMIYSTTAGWGTSVVLMPSFWSGGRYYQGAPVSYTYQIVGGDLLLNLSGAIYTLTAQVQVRLSPPVNDELLARVSAQVNGNVTLDNRPGEAFKPLMLSSMHISQTYWDSQLAYVDCSSYSLPSSGWTINPPAFGTVFGLLGGTSLWKPNAPTIEVALSQPMTITGWVTYTTNPNDDNVGFWAASSQLLRSWSYTLRSSPQRTYEIDGRVTLGNFGGSVTTQPITVELRPAGSTTPLRTETLALDGFGRYRLLQVKAGTYDLSFQGPHWLRKVVSNVRITDACLFNINSSLVNGDVNGDNRIDDSDLAAVIFDFGLPPSGVNGATDLNGDGIVSDVDLSITIFNFGEAGDS